MDKWLISPVCDITIINYDILERLNFEQKYDVAILDEGTYIKNKSSKRSKLCRRIKAQRKIILTGTPVLNKPIELWALLNWLDPAAWPISSYIRYAIRYCGAFQGPWGFDVSGATHLPELRELLKPLMIRRKKEDVLKALPPKRRQVVELPLTGLSAHLKSQLREASLRVAQLEETYKEDIKKLDGALSVAWNEMAELRHQVGDSKVHMVIELVKDAIESSGKVVIFAHHRSVIEELQMGLAEYFPAVIHGGVNQMLRQSPVDRFQKDAKCRVFIAQIQAAGMGITLTASSHVIFAECDWTPGIMTQAEDRCHRLSQLNSVLIQHLVLENSIDCYMAKVLIKKQSVIDQVLGNNNLTEEEW